MPVAPPLWDLPDHPSLAWLRRRAKDLATRFADRDAAAIDLVATYDPGDGPLPLARAQRVIARAYGFAGWSRLREHVDRRVELTRPMAAVDESDGPEDRFLRAACLSYTEPSAAATAGPPPATGSVFLLAACGRADELSGRLDATSVNALGGPHRWPPLLYLCYSRIAQDDAVATMRTLLDHGADPNAGTLWQGFPSAFTALTGVLGGGERGEAPHPRSVTLVEMLLEAGADPNDNQAFYNRAFEPDDSHLPPLLAHGAGRDLPSVWRDRLGTAYPSPAEMVGEHLRSAAEKGYAHRVRLLLGAGVDPNTRGYHPILGDATAYQVAVTHGWPECADLLAAAGAAIDDVDADDLAVGRALAGRAGASVPGLAERRPDAMRLAAELHGVEALTALLELGYDVSTPGRWGTTALHEAALRGEEDTCRFLLDRGASRTARDRRFDSTPSGWATHAGHTALAKLLEPGT